ncbi:hypothetical protein CH276_22725 [Rhodococcus sp. 06-470-2]|uniref:ADP-ribosyltransferase n=1 Tax=unclassified Rhodococcus (in: high G+C Gram-positive bacteria) TaxID=192944 RepID=UPI000B9C33AE|nr:MULTISPECIES: ADP-ribosyltransferase [unclassified Rhodococcus (in: high G+C Gram-positive bacteria)]OZC59264.1 hypothetical protein CH276_22725 [Rhodococcus sp. 06-470-2]OZE63632.1 hypothetical protein CH265_12205 [Rhodococcus sp. 05-2221-1B]
MARRPDPHIAARMRADAFFRRQERTLHAAVITAMTDWLNDARALILGDITNLTAAAITAAGERPDIDAVNASFATWQRGLTRHIEPVINETFGEAFAAQSRTADISPTLWQEHHMATVHDRLKIWPENAFEELRPELLEAMAQNEDIDQIQDRIGRILDIDAPSRRIRADISAIDRKLADPDTPSQQIAGLKGKRRQLWEQHDESLLEWQWKARRIARTEIQGAINAGTWASAEATAQITGETLYKSWLSTHDERTRAEHVVADGQIVPISTSFSVAGFPLMYPGDPSAPGHLVIQCRCSMRVLTDSEVQDELQGMWGGRGVGPGHARLGPDLADDINVAIDKWKREQRGEVVGDNRLPSQVERDARRDAPDTLNPGWSEQDSVRPYDGAPDPAIEPDPIVDDGPIVINIGDDEPATSPPEVVDEPTPEPVPTPEPAPVDVPESEPLPLPRPIEDPLFFENSDHQAELDRATDWAGEAWPIDTTTYSTDINDAVVEYTDEAHEPMNAALRNGTIGENPTVDAQIERLREAIDLAPRVPEPIVVARAVSGRAALGLTVNVEPRSLVGQAFTDPGFMSTSIITSLARSANDSAANDDVLLHLTVPAGYAALYVSGGTGQPLDTIISYAGQSEYELILRDGTTIMVTNTYMDGGQRIIEADVLDDGGSA